MCSRVCRNQSLYRTLPCKMYFQLEETESCLLSMDCARPGLTL